MRIIPRRLKNSRKFLGAVRREFKKNFINEKRVDPVVAEAIRKTDRVKEAERYREAIPVGAVVELTSQSAFLANPKRYNAARGAIGVVVRQSRENVFDKGFYVAFGMDEEKALILEPEEFRVIPAEEIEEHFRNAFKTVREEIDAANWKRQQLLAIQDRLFSVDGLLDGKVEP